MNPNNLISIEDMIRTENNIKMSIKLKDATMLNIAISSAPEAIKELTMFKDLIERAKSEIALKYKPVEASPYPAPTTELQVCEIGCENCSA